LSRVELGDLITPLGEEITDWLIIWEHIISLCRRQQRHSNDLGSRKLVSSVTPLALRRSPALAANSVVWRQTVNRHQGGRKALELRSRLIPSLPSPQRTTALVPPARRALHQRCGRLLATREWDVWGSQPIVSTKTH